MPLRRWQRCAYIVGQPRLLITTTLITNCISITFARHRRAVQGNLGDMREPPTRTTRDIVGVGLRGLARLRTSGASRALDSPLQNVCGIFAT